MDWIEDDSLSRSDRLARFYAHRVEVTTGAWMVSALRRWFQFREILGLPKVLTEEQFAEAGPTTLPAGSPWVRVDIGNTATTGTSTCWTTNTTWDRKAG